MGGFGSPGGGRGRGGKGRGRGGGKGGRGRGGGKGKGRRKGGKGKGKGGAKGGAKVVVEPHMRASSSRRGKEDVIVTLNSTPGKDAYGEKRISVDGPANEDGTTTKIEYRVWNPFRSKLCAAILGGSIRYT